MASVELKQVRRVFDSDVVAIESIDLSIRAGEFVAILGPSGCGKSTLLRIIAGLDRATSGSVEIGGEKSLGYVFQDAHLLPWRNVRRNVELPLELKGIGKRQRREAAMGALGGVGLAEAARRHPHQLSGGMRMRASIARAMVGEPNILLMDEPFAALDEITRQKLDEQLRELWRRRGMTVIFVTHSTTEAVFLADRAVVMSRRPGRVVEDRRIALPETRTGEIRGSAEFAAQTRFVFEALKKGEGGEGL